MKKVFLLISLISSCFSLSAQTTFSYTGTVQTYTVPSGVTTIGIDAAGAQGGNSFASNGGNGGRVQANLTVTPGQVLSIYVGGQGAAGPSSSGTRAGGGNGGGGEGGNGNGYGGGGGGSSDIRTGGTALSNRIIVAAGGGGGGYDCGTNYEPGGNGGGLTGLVGFDCGSANTSSCGSGGTQAAGGTGATSYGSSPGTLGAGGNNSLVIYGGGGGGGYYGGGAGYWGGGGGGSSYYGGSGVSSPSTTPGFKTGNGYVIIYGPTVTSTPGFLNFGNVAVSSTAAAQVFTLSASYMASSPITVNTTSSNVEFSFNGSTWFNTAQTYAYTLPGFSSVPLYVRFTPTASTEYYEYITISGGGLAATKNLLVVGNGVSTCSGTPDAGTATLSPYTGTGSTPFVLALTGYSAAGGLTFQWQSSPTGTGSWTNISGATNATHSFTGISGTTYYQCNVTCTASTLTSSSNVVMASSFPASSCSPTFGTTCPTYTMNTSIASLIGLGGSAITDPSTTCAGNYYTDYSNTQHVTLYKGVTYPATINVSPPYYSSFKVQIWIDFDGDGAFSAGESIAGSNSFASASQVLSLPIPAGAPTGSFRMRIVGAYSSPSFPSIPPCPTASVTYGEARDYKVTIQPLPPCTTPPLQPTSLSLSPSLFTVSGSFTPAIVGADGYLTVVTTSSVAPTPPTDGVTYTVGANALGGRIVAVGSGSSFTATGLTDNTPYWIWVYSMNSACTGGPKYKTASPLNGTISTNACSFSGTKTVGPTGDYISIASALTAINSVGMNGNVALELQTTYTGESYPIVINTLQCANSSRRLTIRPQGTMTVTASASSAMISLNGASYVTIDGRVGSTGTTKALTFTNNSTSSSASTIQLLNDASDNTVKHMTLRGANASSSGGVVMFGTTTGTTGSDNNTFDSTDIMEAVGFSLPINCFYATGTTGKENSDNTISNCNIANFYHSSTTSTGIYILFGNTGWTITGNRIYQSASRSYTSSQINRGIYINNSTSGNGFTISNNIIGYSSNTGSGTYTMTSSSSTSFYGITFSGSTTTPSSIQGNTITNISHNCTSGGIRGIDIVAGSVNIGTSAANIIGAATGNGAITHTVSSNGVIAVYGIYATPSSPAVLNIQNNTIGAITVNGTSTSVGAGIYGIFVSSTASTTISGNTIGSTSTSNSLHSATTTTSTGSQVIYGISASISSTTPVAPVISNNTIANLRGNGSGSSSRIAGILFNSSASGTISGNTIQNLSNASAYTTLSTDISVSGIMYTGSTGTANITQNTINALSNTNNTSTQTHVAGILYSSSVNGSITRNRIYDLSNASTNTSTTSPSTAIGIFCFSPTTSAVIANNMISIGNAQTTNTSFNGIMQGGTSSSAIIRVYYNSVLIMGTASSGSISSAALHRGNYSGSFNSTPFDIQNNLFENNRNGGTGKHYAIADNINGSSTSSGWATNAANYNILNTTNAATVGYWSGDRTFASWKTASACDNNSFTASAATYTNASTGDLHINMGTTANNMESHGVVISGYNTDYDNDTRPGPSGSVNGGGFGVDIGADEFDGVPLDNIPPVINYTNSICGTTGNFTFTATVADPAGVPTTGGLVPRVYYRKGAGTWFSSAGTLTSGTGTNGVWTFTISATDMGGLVSGNVVSYYVIAQDNSAFVGSNPSPGLVATNVNTVTTPPTTPSTFTVGLTGTYSVGSGGDFNTITLAAAAYNGGCLTGPVTYNLITTTYPSETFPITFNGIATANATNTLTIKPASSTAVIIDGASTNGAIFKLLNARHITIDGVNAGGSSLTLNSTWTSTYANIWLASTSGTGPGCSNITLKNMTITGGSNATSGSYGILGGLDNGTFPTTSGGFNNDTITIQNNTITKCYYGIYASGTSSASNGGGDDWVITGNTFGPASSSSTDNIGMRGVHFANMINPAIVNNTFRNIGTSSITSQAAGIYLSSSVNGGSYSQNTISGINNANSSSSTSANAGIYVGTTCINLTISRNIIRDIATTSTSGGARGITINPSNSTANILIANNMISDIKCFGTTSISQCPVGIGVDNTAGFVKVYYNTVHLNSSYAGNTTATGSACYFQNSSSAGTDLRNNNFVNTYDNTNSGTDKGWAFYTTASNTAFAEINHNNYFAGSPNILGYTSADRTTLTELQSAYGRNANSISTSPTFVSATDLRLQTIAGNTALVAGTPVSVTEDIDGTSRNITIPVIGIHEASFCTSITAGTVSAATSNFCVSGTTTITATGATTGQSMQWKSSEDSTSWTTISGATNATYVIPTAITTTTFYRLVNSCTSSAVKDSATTKVTVNANPAAITGNLTACVSATTSLSNTTSGGTWSSSNTAVGTVSSSGTVTALSAGTTEISYTITATGCYTTVVVTVNALPTVSAISASSDNLCMGAAVTFTAGSVTGTGSLVSYNWTGPDSYSTTTTGNTTGFTTTTTDQSGVYSLTVTYTGNGCASSTVTSSTVTVNALPIVYSITGGGSYCSDGLGVAIGLGNSETGVNYQLYNGSTASGSPVAGTGSAISFGSQTATGTYTVRATNPTTTCTSDMSGSTSITISVTPAYYTVTGGGSYCAGGSGVSIGLSSSDVSVSYQLYNGSSLAGSLVSGTGVALDFGMQTGAGTYTIVANPGSACARTMTGSASVSILPVPNVYNVTGGGSLCAGETGVHIGLDWSVSGISYQLYNGATAVGGAIGGATSAIDFGFINTAGTYTVLATNTSTSCTSNMSGSATVSVNPLPTTYSVTGGGTTCENSGAVSVGLSNSATGFTYQLYNGAATVGTPLSGTGAALSFGPQNTSGTYTVLATNNTTLCTNAMTGSAVVVINPAPTAYTVTGGGNYCSGGSGVSVGLSGSNTGIHYQLYNGGATVGSPVPGTGSAISFGNQTAAATFTVVATNTVTACPNNMTGSATVVINALPTVHTVTGGGSYCAGGSGVAIGLSSSNTGINYQLYNGSSTTGSPVAGTGATISYGNQTAAGTYTVRATNTTTSCVSDMTGSAVVVINPLPTAQTVTGGGSYCTGGSGVNVDLNGSATGINYQLYNGASPAGSAIAGTGSAISFGLQTAAGTYTVRATNSTTGCVNDMTASATVVVNPLPTVFVVTGGGNYCAGGTGVAVGLNGSESGSISYQLYNGAAASGSPVTGTGAAISFGLITTAGAYSVLATNTGTACTSNMFGSTPVVIDPLPTPQNITGGGSYCAGGSGLPIGLDFSNTGINYQLYNGASAEGSPVAGTGVAISFGSQTASGTYSVLATNSITTCTNAMTGTATIIINPLPTVQTVTGGGTYCENFGGVAVGLSGSQTGIAYQLYNGASTMGSPVAGTGSAISFGAQTLAGTYTVVATNTVTACTNSMSGSAIVIMNPAPTAHTVTGGGSYCAGSTGVTIGLSNSNTGITYQIYNGSATAGSPVAGTGSAISFGTFTNAGTYTVLATNNATSCTRPMTSNAIVIVNPLPLTYSMTGGGEYCAGASGVNVGLSSSEAGINYQLYRGGTAVGSPLSGTGAAISFGLQTVAGTYSILATNTTTSCIKAMTGTAVVVMNALPIVYNVTGGGNACLGGIGVNVGVNMSQTGVNYSLRLGTIVMGTLGGTASGINFGMMYASGTYSVLATNATTGCSSAMSGSASVVLHNPPVAYTMTGGGSYCAGGGGVAIGLSNSATGVNYRLYAGSTAMGSGPTAGTGAAISFGSQTVAGTYTVLATSTTSGCTNTMTGSTTISINSLPGIHTVSGGGNYCPGAGGANISLSGSNTGITYQLYVGSTPIGTPVTGSGATLYMGTHTTVGTYSAVATNVTTGCTSDMAGSATIAAYSLPNVYLVTGGGNYCSGGAGVAVGLSGSETGVSYQLYNGSSIVGTYTGTGTALSFGILGAAGTYSVRATNTSTSCVNNMTGTATIIINDLPNTYLVTGGGNYCAGGSGYSVILNGSNTGINYQLFNGTAAMGASIAGTGSAINFGLQTVAGMYTVRATNATTGCTRIMAGSPTIIVHPLPTVFNVSGGGSYCIGSLGVEITLDGSNAGIGYQLLSGSTTVGSMMSGSGGAVSFGLHTIPGTYTIMATNTGTGCTSNMAGSAFVVANPVPAIQTVTGGGGYCSGSAGSPVGINASATGTNYQLYRGTATVGSPLSGVGGALEFGLMTTPGIYTVRAVISATGCTSNMTGTAVVSINPLPNEYSVSGGGVYCSGGVGANITLGGSDAGVTYRLYTGSLLAGTLSGTGSSLDFGPQTSGVYTVLATNTTTSCQNTMTGSASVIANPIPVPFVVTGGGIHCTGSAGVAIGLAGSQTGVNYSLYNAVTATGSVVSGTGSAVSFGLQAATGNYTVLATNATTACTNAMTGSVTVSVNPLPAVQSVTGGGSYCAGGAGVTVGLASSETGMLYQLYKNGTALSSYVGGTGGAISFGAQHDNGEYTVMAINIATTCTRLMSGSATVNTNHLPVVYNVTGGGAYCSGGSGVTINLSGSSSGISYQLYNGTMPIGSPITASGSAINYNGLTAAGIYTILATNTATACSKVMSGTATVSINPLPVVENVTGGGAYCAGSAGVSIGLSSSTTGVAYTLYNGTTAAGSPIAGTGSALNFGVISGAGTYTVSAINSSTACAAAMAGSATISVNTLPAAFEVLGGGGYCAGGTGVSLALSGSQTGVNYLLYNSATGTTTTFAGTGDLIEFGMQTVAGTYTVSAVNTTTSCTSNMTGEAAIVISPMPVAFGITGGGNYCTATAGVTVGLNGSEFGVNYRLYKDGIATGTIVAGTGVAISFGTHAATGVYTAIAENTASTCSIAMTGSATIGVHPTPAVYTISAGGSYCTGTAGLMVSLNNSENGVNYRLYNGATLVGSFVAGTGSAISFGMQPAGLYSIMATNTSTSCTAAMSGIAAISVNALPVIYNVTGSGGYCSDAAGVAVGLSGSQNNVNYQLYNGAAAIGSSVAGNGGAINFGNYPAGIYSVVGTSVITTCTSNMTGNANIFINAQPNTYNVSGGGDICAGAAGVTISLDGSQTGVNYRLHNGTTAVGSIVAGTGTSLNFGMITAGGMYTIRAQNTGNTCTRTMTGSASVAVNPLPVVYSVTGGGSFCPGGTGVSIGLSGSEAGVDYQLYSGSSMAGASVAGTGSAIDFGMYTAEGSYMVVATNTTTSCGANMSGSANVAINSQPAVYTLASSASGYCEGGAGVLFNLSGSQSGVTYRLYNGTTPVSGVTTGTGSSINFGLKTLAGSYSVLATNVLNGCTTVMTGSPSITVNPLPGVFTVSGGGAYCAGGSGAPITIIGSQTGINYQLYNGTTPIGSGIAGTGTGLTFGTTLPAGMYTVKATNPVSSCTSNMMGTASVIVNALPSTYNVTGGGQYCTGGSGLPIGLAGSSTGITYRLYNTAGIVGSPVTGTGAALSFGMHTAAGSYSITATNPVSACTVNMTGTAVINASATLAVHTVTGGGAICSGATGAPVGLSGSANGVNYRLYNGTTPVGLAMAGTGSALSFGTHATAGTYTILATDAATSCTKAMSGNAVISINSLPAVQTVTGGGNYCTGGSGVSVGLDGSATGVSYRLYHGTTAMGTIAGGGSPLDFGMQTSTGAYTIKATNTTTGCTSTMAGTAVIGVTPSVVPSVSLTATTGDTVCAGTTAMFTTATTNAGSTPSYAWYVNGVEAAGTAASFSYTPAHGDVVRVAMSSSAACALPATTTDERTLTVRANQMPAVTAVVEGDTLCEGNPVTITATALYGGDNPSFTWVKNGITSAVGNVFTYTPANGDVISVRMTSNYSCRLATLVNGENDTLNIAVPYEPVVSIVANPGTTIAEGQILTLTAAATLTYMPTYQWHLNGNPIHGATSSSFTYNNYEDKDTVTVSVTNNTPCGALSVFNTVLINVNSVGVATVDQNTVDVRLMPNPANGTFTIKGTIGSKGNDAIEIEITDMLGQIVYRGSTELKNGSINKSIELSSALANGMYLVNLRTPAANKVFHLILQR